MSGRRVPALIKVSVVALAGGYSIDEARAILLRAGVLYRDGRLWKARRGLLRERLPDLYEDVFTHYELGEAVEDVAD